MKLDLWKKKQQREDADQSAWDNLYDRHQDTTRSSLFAGEDDWDVPSSRPVFSAGTDGRARSYEDFLRARNRNATGGGRGWDSPYARRFHEDDEGVPGLPVRRAMQILGALALVGGLYFTFQSDGATAQKITAYVQTQLQEDTDLGPLTAWWKNHVGGGTDSAVPASSTPSETFALPVQGTVKRAYDGQEQQGVTFKAATGAEIKAAGKGIVEKVVKEEGKEDYTIIVNHGSAGRTHYSHIVVVDAGIKEQVWVEPGQVMGTLAKKGEAELFFAFEKNGAFKDPGTILDLKSAKQ